MEDNSSEVSCIHNGIKKKNVHNNNKNQTRTIQIPYNNNKQSRTSHYKTELNVDVKQVIRIHHIKIEELMRSIEADVGIISSVKNRDLDPQLDRRKEEDKFKFI